MTKTHRNDIFTHGNAGKWLKMKFLYIVETFGKKKKSADFFFLGDVFSGDISGCSPVKAKSGA